MAKETIAQPARIGAVIQNDDLMLATGAGAIVVADATLNEEWSSDVQVTEHPVESGATFADHAQLMPFELSLTLHLTDTPVFGENEPGRGMAKFNALEAMRDAREPLTVFLDRRAFDGMLITSLNRQFPDPPEAAVTCSIRLKQVRLVAPERVMLEAVDDDPSGSRDRAADEQDRGSQPTDAMTSQEAKAALDAAAMNPRTVGDMMFGDQLQTALDGGNSDAFYQSMGLIP